MYIFVEQRMGSGILRNGEMDVLSIEGELMKVFAMVIVVFSLTQKLESKCTCTKWSVMSEFLLKAPL